MSYFNRILMPDRGAWDGNTLYHLFDVVSDPANSSNHYMLKVLETAGVHFGDLNKWEPVANFADPADPNPTPYAHPVIPYQRAVDLSTLTTTTAGYVAMEYLNKLVVNLKAAGLLEDTAPTLSVTSLSEDLAITPESVNPSISCVGASSDGQPVSYQWYSSESDSNATGASIGDASESVLSGVADWASNGTYYYFCEITIEDVTLKSDVVTVTVSGFGA